MTKRPVSPNRGEACGAARPDYWCTGPGRAPLAGGAHVTERGPHVSIRSALAASGRWLRSVRPERRHLRADIVAGLPGAIGSVPDGMAAAVLVGVNPVQGLYAGFAGPIAGGLSSSTRLMVITTTSAAALAAGSALQGVPADQRPGALLLLTLMVGVAL